VGWHLVRAALPLKKVPPYVLSRSLDGPQSRSRGGGGGVWDEKWTSCPARNRNTITLELQSSGSVWLFGSIFSYCTAWFGSSQTFSRINTAIFLNLVILHTYPPMKMEQTECSETSAYKIQTSGNYPEESIQHSEHGESLKLKIFSTICVSPDSHYISFLYSRWS
jgi:hypothetical protein